MDVYTLCDSSTNCYSYSSTCYHADPVYPDTDYITEQLTLYGDRNQWDPPTPPHTSQSCVDSLKHRLANGGTACSPYGQFLFLLENEEALRTIGAKSLNALFRQVALSAREVSAVKLHKRRLRKRIAKRGWDCKERTRDQWEKESLRLLEEERETLRSERELLLREIRDLEAKLKQ